MEMTVYLLLSILRAQSDVRRGKRERDLRKRSAGVGMEKEGRVAGRHRVCLFLLPNVSKHMKEEEEAGRCDGATIWHRCGPFPLLPRLVVVASEWPLTRVELPPLAGLVH